MEFSRYLNEAKSPAADKPAEWLSTPFASVFNAACWESFDDLASAAAACVQCAWVGCVGIEVCGRRVWGGRVCVVRIGRHRGVCIQFVCVCVCIQCVCVCISGAHCDVH